MSMSSGDATVSGNHVEYILRMPLYEVARTAHPETALFGHIRFWSGGREGHMLNHECHADAARDTYLCAAYYEFPAQVEHLAVDCTFYEVTVPNHIHLLRAENDGKHDQAIFDYTFTHAELLFRPPTAFETAMREIAAGAMRAIGGAVPVLFLIALALAARNRRELLTLVAIFTAALIAGTLQPWRPPPRFVDLAGAVVVGYLAAEMIFLPHARWRSPIAGVLGFVHGLYFALFLRGSDYRAQWVLSGAILLDVSIALLAGALALRIDWGRFKWLPAALMLAAAVLVFTNGYQNR